MQINDALYRVQLTVKDYSKGKSPHKLYALESFEIEDALLGILPSSPPDSVVQKAQPTTGRTISIEQLLRGQCAMMALPIKSRKENGSDGRAPHLGEPRNPA